MDGMITVYKEKGYTSHDVVAKLRGILHQKKIGHTGTLDPDAAGVLPICLGKGTKLCELLTDKDKTYVAVCRLGIETDTQDMTGQVLQQHRVNVTVKEVKECITSFLGAYEQVPPMYSALKVGGRKLCDLAREGISVERKARTVMIHTIELLSYDETGHTFTIKVHCSKGTYIRTLCHDIGQKLGCGAAMQELTRTRVAQFVLEEALTLKQVEELYKSGRLDAYVIPVDAMFPSYGRVYVRKEACKRLYNGNVLYREDFSGLQKEIQQDISGQELLVYDDGGRFIAIYRKTDREYKPVKMFYSIEDGRKGNTL